MRLICVALVILCCFTGCAPADDEPVGEGGWLAGGTQQKLNTVSKHLRGFDMAMVEAGYRYGELHWAGEARNWPYADYQVQKIRTAIENGLERRPKRAASAQTFLSIVLPAIADAVKQQDYAAFRQRFDAMTSACITCHEAEQVAFVHVAKPVTPSPFAASPAESR